jgi:predicted DsbA family dithiol-disulfide isomerase
LCIWAYVAEARLDELRKEFGSSIELEYRFIPIFGATRYRIGEGWEKRGGYAGFGQHVREVANDFPHVTVNERVWSEVAPTTSAAAHEVLCAARLLTVEGELDPARRDECHGRTLVEEAAWQVRRAFFEGARDISDRGVLLDVLEQIGIPRAAIEAKLHSGEAMAEVCRDIELRDRRKIEGSPTYYLNNGRQKLYGNVGYRVVSANLRELLERPEHQASWC